MKALELKPQHFGALNGLILVFTKLRDIDSVVETLYQLDEVHPASANGIRDQLKSAVDFGQYATQREELARHFAARFNQINSEEQQSDFEVARVDVQLQLSKMMGGQPTDVDVD